VVGVTAKRLWRLRHNTVPIHQGSAVDAQIGSVLEHARRDGWNVGDIRASEPERIGQNLANGSGIANQ
jgi:hypothetical protein